MTRLNNSQKVLLGSSMALIGLEVISAFIIAVPVAAIVYAALLAVGVFWLIRSPSRGPAIYLGVLHLIEVMLAFSFLSQPASETGGPALLGPVIAASIAGVVGAAGSVTATRQLQRTQ